MKLLRVLLILFLIIAGLIFIVPLFMPAISNISAEQEIEVSPEQVFHNAARFANRDKWDPWLKMEPDAKVEITSNPDYIGSTYSWDGKKIKTGKMQVDSIVFGEFIGASIWFGRDPEPAKIEWTLEDNGHGTKVTWTFITEGKYPFGRLMMALMSGSMKSSFESGLKDLKTLLEADPPKLYKLSEIHIGNLKATHAMTVPASGTVEEIGQQMMKLFPMLYKEILSQGLNVTGPAFAQYYNYDAAAGTSDAILCFPVDKQGKQSAYITPREFFDTKAVMATHYGKYEYFTESYAQIMQYITDNELDVSEIVVEIYEKPMINDSNPMDWETMIAFPLK